MVNRNGYDDNYSERHDNAREGDPVETTERLGLICQVIDVNVAYRWFMVEDYGKEEGTVASDEKHIDYDCWGWGSGDPFDQ